MGKEGELWDDSALIKAFDHAFTKYKMMHGTTEEKSINENIPADNGSNETHVQNMDNPYSAIETTTKIGEPTEIIQSKEELGSSNIQDSNVIPTNEIPTATSGKHISSDIKTQNDAIMCSNGPEEYSMLLNKYYEVEGQRQQILQQLYQYSNSNEQFPISTAEGYQTSIAQPYDTVACQCPYGCQNWVVPCNSLPNSCLGGNNVDNCCQDMPKGSQNGNSMSPEGPDFVKTAMIAAERALLLTKQANGGRDQQVGMEMGHIPESNSGTDLHVVLNAWYSAGFYTGKFQKLYAHELNSTCIESCYIDPYDYPRYLSEQSLDKRKHEQEDL